MCTPSKGLGGRQMLVYPRRKGEWLEWIAPLEPCCSRLRFAIRSTKGGSMYRGFILAGIGLLVLDSARLGLKGWGIRDILDNQQQKWGEIFGMCRM